MTCPYCDRPAQLLAPGAIGYPYPANWGPAWICIPCDAYVRCYAGSVKPLGTLANEETRLWRGRAHAALDALWQGGAMTRGAAYAWLANAIGLPRSRAHIALMDPAACQQVIDLVARRNEPAAAHP